jgi:hypothetical protein
MSRAAQHSCGLGLCSAKAPGDNSALTKGAFYPQVPRVWSPGWSLEGSWVGGWGRWMGSLNMGSVDGVAQHGVGGWGRWMGSVDGVGGGAVLMVLLWSGAKRDVGGGR